MMNSWIIFIILISFINQTNMIFINRLVHRSMMDIENGILSKTLKSNGYGYNREYGEFELGYEWNDEFEYGIDDHIVFTLHEWWEFIL